MILKINWSLLPIILSTWILVCLLVTYLVSVNLEHVYPFVPYISDTGVYSPESCIFSQMMNIGCFLMGGTVYIRYRLLDEVYRNCELKRYVKITNIVGVWTGAFAILGVGMVGNFQEKNSFKLHFVGACLAYNLGSVYLIMQVFLTVWAYPHIGSKLIIIIRISIVVIFCFCYAKCFVFAMISWPMLDETANTEWTPRHAGYTYHVISAVDEWIMTVLILMFFSTYAYEFRYVTVSQPEIQIAINENVEIM